ncbi:MAG: right-handed parallel beta-helix repeat-containing protein [Muribaculaceae bacterium]|nr:right-handed parallel beta-helix repeat-containing protein [Muribaculaceae bacterium]
MTKCTFSNVNTAIDYSKGTSTITCILSGANNFGNAAISDYASVVLNEGATLTAPEYANVTTDVEGYKVAYANGKYYLYDGSAVAKIGEQGYETLAAALEAAQAGETITFLADITEDVTTSNAVTIDGAGKTYTGKMTLKADATIKNVNFDGKGYNGYAVETRGAQYLTIEDCTATNYGYGFVQLASATALTTVKNVTVSNMNYGVKVDYSNAVVLENVDIDARVAAVLNSNYGEKTITIKVSNLSILGTWTRNNTIKTNYVFEGANSIDQFKIDAAIDNLMLKAGATLTAPEGITVTTDISDYDVRYQDGKYYLVEVEAEAEVGNQKYKTLAKALEAAQAGQTITLLKDITSPEIITINKAITLDGNGNTITYTGANRAIDVPANADAKLDVTINNLTVDCTASYCQRGINYNEDGKFTLVGVTVKGKNVTYALNLPGSSDNAEVTIKDSNLSGNIALNVWGENSVINATNTVFTAVDNNTVEGYAAVKLNNDGTTSAEGTVINIVGGKIDVTGTACTDTEAVSNGTSSGVINISNTTTVNGEVATIVAAIRYENGTSYSFTRIEDAIAKAKEGETVTLLRDITSSDIITINKAITLDGNGKTLTSTAARAINVDTEGEVAISNLTIKAAERAINIINKPATVELNHVTATANNNAVMIATSAGAAKVTIDGCDFTGLAVVNVAGAKSNVAIKNSKITNVDASDAENYGAITVWTSAEEAVVNVENTTITVADDSKKAYVFPATAIVTGVDGVGYIIATIGDAGFDTLADAVAAAQDRGTIKLVRDAVGAGVVINKNITIDFNGNTYTANEGVGSAGTQTLGLQILKDNTVTLKNGTLTSEGGNVKMLVQNYANLTVEKMNLVDATDAIQYVLSNNCGNVVVKNASKITANGAIAFDACKYANYALPTVTIAEGVEVTGDVEVSATLNFEGALNGKIIINGAEGIVNSTVEGLDVTTTIEGRNVVYANSVYTTAEFEPVAKVNGKKYASLRAAVDAAPAGATVYLLKDVTLEGGYADDPEAGLRIEKAITINGQENYTIDCGKFQKGIRVYNPDNDKKGSNEFYGVTIVNNNVNGRCIDTRDGNINLIITESHLIAQNGNSQPLTLGGSEPLRAVTIRTHSTIDAGKSGYAVINFVTPGRFINVAGDCKISGYAAFYVKADNTKLQLANVVVTGENVHNGDTNGFGAIVVESSNNTISLNARAKVKAVANSDQFQSAFLIMSGSNNNIVINDDAKVPAEVVLEGENAYLAMVEKNSAASTSIVKYGAEMPLAAECDNYQYLTFDEAFRAANDGSTVKLLADVKRTTENENYVTDCDGYASIINVEGKTLTFDLNGKTMTVNAYAEDLAYAKDEMLLAVFSTDECGKLTLKDSSEDKTGKVEVVANDAMVYSLITNYDDGCFVTIEGGNYIADKVYDSLIYSGASDCVTVNDGNFRLDNVGQGERGNGSPWIFNALGQNQRNIDVYGGTFNADINHQYWCFEVDVPTTSALHNNNDGTWTVVDAEAYVVEPKGEYTHEVGYPTLREAIACALELNNTSVVMVKNVVTEPIAITEDKALTLDLNGSTIAGTDTGTASYGLININPNAELIINGDGTISVTATQDRGWNAYSSVISNQRGKLTVNGGTIQHNGGTAMAYAIDNLTNGKGTYAETIINGGTIKSTYRAIRQFLNGTEADNILTVKGGTIEGTNKSIWMQDPSKNANTGSLTVDEDATLKGDVYLFVTAGSTEWPVDVMIAKDALEGESTVVSGNVPEGYAVSEYPTYWTVEALNLAELTIEDACTSYVNVAEKNVGKLTYVRNFENTEWQTLYLPFAVPAANLMNEFEVAYIYNASTKDGLVIDYVVVKDGEYILQANYPYLIKAKEIGTKEIVVNDVALMPTEVNSIDCSTVFETFEFTGSYTTVKDEPCADATAEVHASKGHFVMNEGAWKKFDVINPFRVYLTITLRNGSEFAYPTEESIIMRKVDKNGNVDTSVEKIGVDADILGIYDLQGRRVLEPQKGEIYIINGKKVVF